MSYDDNDNPRTPVDLIRDLAEMIRDRQWVETYIPCGRGCCGDWAYLCPECGNKEPGTNSGRRGKEEGHEKGCRLRELLDEAETLLSTDAENQECSGSTSWDHLLEEAQV